MSTSAVTNTSLTDKLAIEALVHLYSDGVNRCDWDQVESVFVPDAVWESPLLGFRHESARDFRDFLAQTETFDLLVQTPHATVVRLLGDTARATTTVHEICRDLPFVDGPLSTQDISGNFENYGIYYDDLARRDGQWRFTHRLYVPLYMNQGCVAGTVMTTRPELLARASVDISGQRAQ